MGLSILEVKPAEMPAMLYDRLKQGGANPASGHTRAYKNDSIPYNENIITRRGAVVSDNKRQHLTTCDNIGFEEGRRDNTLFHLANCLVKGGMPTVNIEKYFHRVCSLLASDVIIYQQYSPCCFSCKKLLFTVLTIEQVSFKYPS